jgi:hypothetical protein
MQQHVVVKITLLLWVTLQIGEQGMINFCESAVLSIQLLEQLQCPGNARHRVASQTQGLGSCGLS